MTRGMRCGKWRIRNQIHYFIPSTFQCYNGDKAICFCRQTLAGKPYLCVHDTTRIYPKNRFRQRICRNRETLRRRKPAHGCRIEGETVYETFRELPHPARREADVHLPRQADGGEVRRHGGRTARHRQHPLGRTDRVVSHQVVTSGMTPDQRRGTSCRRRCPLYR